MLMAIEKIPDLIPLDWMLPLLSGVEVCRRLNRTPETRSVPINMLTARGDEGDRFVASMLVRTTISPNPSARSS